MKFESLHFPSRRSNVISRNGLVATSQPLAAQAGLDILKAGGNAVDAAIATVAALCVVEPCSTGVGGDAFGLIWWEDEKRLYGINASGPAPKTLSADRLRAQGHSSFPRLGGLSVTVPGSVRGWQLALDRFGSLELGVLLEQAINYAAEGYPVSQRIARSWQHSAELLGRQSNCRRVWLPGGNAPRAGADFNNPAFAESLSILVDEGYDAFYEGKIGREIVDAVVADGGMLSREDLVSYSAEWVEPIALDFPGGYRFHEIPPNGQGLTALLALGMARELGLDGLQYGSADYYHTLIEVMKMAFADAHAYIGDPRQVDVPIEDLLSESYLRQRAALILLAEAADPRPGNPSPHGDTVYLTVADRYGNMVSWIQSLYMGFGSGLTTATTGIQLQNRGANFNLIPGHPNEAGPGKRPYHTIIPGFITKDLEAWSSFGVMGGFMQPQGHLQVGLNLVQQEMDPQTALDATRFNWLQDRTVALELSASPGVREELLRRGHRLVPPDEPMQYGGGQAIVRLSPDGALVGGSEPRNDGSAVGW